MRLSITLTTLAAAWMTAACSDDSTPGGGPGGGTQQFRVTIENIAPWTVLKSGEMNQRVDGSTGALASGGAYEVTFTAGAGQAVSFATMLGESNDWFFSPGPAGIALYDGSGAPRSGDVTSEIRVWDAGTEVDEEPAVGGSTGPQQTAPDQGAPDPNPTVRALGQTVPLSGGGSFQLPPVDEMIRVTLTPGANRRFTLRIENVSDDGTLVTSLGARQIHLSPFVWAVHIADSPLFDEGAADRGEGLEQIAEAGRTAMLGSVMGELSGHATPLSPGVYVVASEGEPLYSLGAADRGQGLERIAEDGNARPLSETVSATPPEGTVIDGFFDTPAGIDAPGAARPGSSYEFTVEAAPGDRLSFATMFGMSNDWFFGTPPAGIALFEASGEPVSGDVTGMIEIYDAGTELDEEPAVGAHTGPQQEGPDSGPADPVAQVRVSSYERPATAHVRVRIEPVE